MRWRADLGNVHRLPALLLGPNANPYRAGQVDAAMNHARRVSAIAIMAAVPLFIPAHGLWPIAVVAIWMGWNLIATGRSRRSDYPELWLLSLTCVTQTVFAACAVASGGPTSPVLAWMVLPLVTAPARYSDRGVAIATGYGLVCLLVPSLALGLDAFLAAPQLPAVVASAGIGSLAYARAMRSTEDLQREAATSDPLTGLANRAALRDSFGRFARQDASARRIGLLIFDLDHFKAVNDEYGHDAGDLVLVDVAQVILRTIPEGAQAYRLGGEEFVVVVPGASCTTVRDVGEQVRRAVEFAHAGQLPVTISGGGTSGLVDLDELGMATTVFRAADAALYDAKRSGRNRFVVQATHLADAERPAAEIDVAELPHAA